MERVPLTYTAHSLCRLTGVFEERYGITSAEFRRRYRETDPVPGVSAFDCHVWASMLDDIARMSEARGGDAFVEHAERTLARA
jgi:hypothetical protein